MQATVLHHSQSDFAGGAACTVAACFVGNAMLQLASSATLAQLLECIDQQVAHACAVWNALELGFLAPREALALVSELTLCSEEPADALHTLRSTTDNSVVLRSVETVLREWAAASPLGDTFCVLVRNAYSFLVFQHAGFFYCVDTHENALQRRRSAITRNFVLQGIPAGRESKGLLLRTLFLLDVVQFVEAYDEYATLGEQSTRNQIDVCIFARRGVQ